MFIAILKQCSEGCDYSIGCGVKAIDLEAQTWDDAMSEARAKLSKEYRQEYERALDNFTIIEVAQRYDVPVDAWYAEIKVEEKQQQAGLDKDKRRQEYERLKREFGGS